MQSLAYVRVATAYVVRLLNKAQDIAVLHKTVRSTWVAAHAKRCAKIDDGHHLKKNSTRLICCPSSCMVRVAKMQ